MTTMVCVKHLRVVACAIAAVLVRASLGAGPAAGSNREAPQPQATFPEVGSHREPLVIPRLPGARDDSLTLVEVAGAAVVLRVTVMDAEGSPVGGGRVIVLNPMESRTVRLGDVLPLTDPRSDHLLIETLQGPGRARIQTAWLTPLEVNELAMVPRTPHRVLSRQLQPTSNALIDQAEGGGLLDHETAVLYRVYAIFGDARLPLAYRGDDSKVFESLYLTNVQGESNTYSAATQAALQPYFVPPAYSESWTTTAGVRATSVDAGPCSSLSSDWTYAEWPSGKVRVWYLLSSNDAIKAGQLASAADTTIWSGISDFMAPHEPLSDADTICNGGSGRLDVYLTDVPRSFTKTVGLLGTGSTCSNGPAYIVLNRSENEAVLAHEIFHAFQFSLPIPGGECLTDGNYRWWTEGSAEWVIDKVYPKCQEEQVMAQYLMNYPELPLDLDADDHIYATYLLPFFYYHKTGSATFVKQAWENCSGLSAVKAFDAAIPGGLKQVWPQFAVEDWNSKSTSKYRYWDGLAYAPVEVDRPDIATIGGAPDKEYPIPFDLPKLSTKYEHYVFADPSIRSVAFWNGATFDLQEATMPIISQYWNPQPIAASAREGVRVQALYKIKGQDYWVQDDWTEKPVQTFCRDVAAERLEELVIIISNSQFLDPNKRAKPVGHYPLLSVSNVGCYKWSGTATATRHEHAGTVVVSTVASPLSLTRIAETDPGPVVSYSPTGTLTVQESGACTGGGVFDVTADGGGALIEIATYVPLESSGSRTYALAGMSPSTFPVTGKDCTSPDAVLGWLLSPAAPPRRSISADGTAIKGSFATPDSTIVWTWDLHSEAEP